MNDVLTWIILGLIAGAIARLLIPGKQLGGLITTIILGIIGALLGGYVGEALIGKGVNGIDSTSIILAVIGSVVIISVWSTVFGKH